MSRSISAATFSAVRGQKVYVVFDLDGTLINIDSVVHLAQSKEWEAFADATMDCPPFPQMVEYARFIQRMKTIDWIVCTAKPERLRQRTLNWLSMQGLVPDMLLMRPAHDFRPSAELKLSLVKEALGNEWLSKILFAVEDRDKVVDAWRAAGVSCLQCAPSLY